MQALWGFLVIALVGLLLAGAAYLVDRFVAYRFVDEEGFIQLQKRKRTNDRSAS